MSNDHRVNINDTILDLFLCADTIVVDGSEVNADPKITDSEILLTFDNDDPSNLLRLSAKALNSSAEDASSANAWLIPSSKSQRPIRVEFS